MEQQLQEIAELLRQRNEIDAKIAAITERPMAAGHLGEWIASKIFDIELEISAVAAAVDGVFRSGPVAGRKVNIKWYLKREGLLDMTLSNVIHDYLVMTGPPSPAVSSKRQTRPWRIDNVYLFDAHALRADLEGPGAKHRHGVEHPRPALGRGGDLSEGQSQAAAERRPEESAAAVPHRLIPFSGRI